MASPLLLQIKDRTTAFLNNTGISQAQLCRYLAIDHSSLSQFLSGNKGLDPSVIIRLCQTLNLSRKEVATKFSEPVRSSKILNLQESVQGRPARMRLDGNDGAWVPGLIGSGTDPNDAIGNNTIVDPPDATGNGPSDEDLRVLRHVRGLHRKPSGLSPILSTKPKSIGTAPPLPRASNFPVEAKSHESRATF